MGNLKKDEMDQRVVIRNANIISMASDQGRHKALGVEKGKIVALGDSEAVQPLIDRGWPTLDLEGKTLLPGFIDTHQHMMLTGLMASSIDFSDVKALDQLLERLSQAVKGAEKNTWIRGAYFNEQNIKEKRMPTKTDLDKVSPHNPVYLLHATCHLCSFNTRALEIINAPMDLGGMDMRNGRPTGVIRDPGILTFVHPRMSRLTPGEAKLGFLKEAAHMALNKGITTLHALDGGDLGQGDTKIIWLNREELPVKVVCYNQSMHLDEVRELGLPRVGGCICADGAFEAHTAALFEPYTDEPDNYGELTYSQETMDRFILEANRADLQIAVHCESERAVEQVLWSMEKALRDHPRNDHRHRIEHLELPTINQISRMAEAGIMASMQPAFLPAFVGMRSMELYASLLGKSRLGRIHPYRTILNHHIPISGGSDSPVTPYDPLAGIQAAVTHPNPQERVGIEEAIKMFTSTAAWSAFEEKEKGTIERGKSADFVVLERDPFQVPAEEISAIKIEMVFVDGAIIPPADL